MDDTLIHRQVQAARAGTNPAVVAKMRSGWAVMGERQFLPGYCLLLPDPVVPTLNALPVQARATFLEDMTRLGDAILQVTGAVRINYEILGNLEPALHAHLFPRYDTEPADLRTRPAWFYDWSAAPEFVRGEHERFILSVARILNGRP
jgi:diadenosine tetraphosphate (Ap4A) HIT family hydrolase